MKRLIGSGAMARVYLADDLEAGGVVAVKVLKPELSSAVAAERFVREIQLIATLQHPNIVPLLDAGAVDGVPYFVMPFVEGLSLRTVLKRERQLPVATVVRYAQSLARALEAAHALGIVHRDVKPENVLLHGDDVLLADFGIARAFSEAAGEKLTESGIALGTPGYMSPEQASGETELDGRSDIYSLACLCYEMLAGEPPFTGPTIQAIIAKQLTLAVPPIGVVRDTLPDAVDDTLRKALAKVPADRFQRATDFAAALDVATRTKTSGAQRVLRRIRRAPASMIAIAGVAVALAAWEAFRSGETEASAGGAVAADTTRYAVLPLSVTSVTSAAGTTRDAATQVVRAALLKWDGLSVADDATLRERLAGRGGNAPSGSAAASLARASGAGRYLRGELAPSDSGISLRLQLFDAGGGGTLLREASGRAPSVQRIDSIARVLVDSLLLRNAIVADEPLVNGTRSLPARQAYAAGRRALDDWTLAAADSAFSAATRYDARFAHAFVWLAVTRLWSGSEPARWRIAAEQGVLGAASLTARERVVADAVLAQSRGDLARACPLWKQLTARDSLDAFAWFGSAQCQASDNAVLPDARGPSGWRFRSSYHHALQEYQRSFRLHPPILASFRGGAFESLRLLFRTAGNELRGGHALPPSTQRFTSNMAWMGDSLAFIPYPRRGDAPPRMTRGDAAVNEAVRHQRELVRGVASSWVAAFPEDADAWQALAMALASLGDISSLDTLARAAALAESADERGRVASARVAMLVAFALRDADAAKLATATALADSLLAGDPGRATLEPMLLSSLAALTGRAEEAVRHARAPAVGDAMRTPPSFRELVPALLIHSALWGPGDTLRGLEQRVLERIEQAIPPAERVQRRLEWVARAASLAFPAHRFAQLEQLGSEGDPLVALQAMFVHGDTAAVRAGLKQMGSERGGVGAENLTLDALVPEAALMLSLGDAGAAASWLDPTLASLPLVAPQLLSSPVRAASLGTAALVRARAAARMGDAAAARRWGSVVVALWARADPYLQPFVREAQALSR